MINEEQPLLLLVDDTPGNIKLLAGILEGNFRLAIATDGSQALDMALDTPPDLILLDVMMPDLDGFEVCRRLKANDATASIPVIFLTAKTEADDVIEGFKSGGVDYLTKPFIREELMARVSVHLRIQRLMRELEAKNAELQRLTETDALTGISNRRFIMARLDEIVKISLRHKFPVGALMLDIDFFKDVNDAYGHQAGDEVLVKIAAAIRESIRETDWLGRYGGEEFLVCFPYTESGSAFQAAEKVRLSVEALQWNYPGLRVTISGGLAQLEAKDKPETLIARADELLYRAKKAGRNRICLADQADNPGVFM